MTHKLINGLPRRSRMDLLLPAETAIKEAVAAVEVLGCDVTLTEAVNCLHRASELVSNFIDENLLGEPTSPIPGTRGLPT